MMASHPNRGELTFLTIFEIEMTILSQLSAAFWPFCAENRISCPSSGRCKGQHTVDLRMVVLERSNTWTDEVLERSNSCGATVLAQVF